MHREMGELRAGEVAHEGGRRFVVRPQHHHVTRFRPAPWEILHHVKYNRHRSPPVKLNGGGPYRFAHESESAVSA